MLLVITIMIFTVTVILLLSGAYFFIEAPAAKKKMRVRLNAIEEAAMSPRGDLDSGYLRDEVYSQVPSINRFLTTLPLMNRLRLFISQAGVNITVAQVILACFSLFFFTFLVCFILLLPWLMTFTISIGMASIPFMYVSIKRQRRFAKFGELFPDAIDMLARAVRAGHAFTTSFELIAQEMPEPLAGEFRITFEQQNLGMPLSEALHNLCVRMPLSDVLFFSSALQIQRESGGNLGEILDNLAQVMRDRFKVLRQVKVFSAQGRMTLYVLMAMFPGFTLLMYLRNPTYIGRLFTDPLGQKALTVVTIMQVIGFFIIRKIIRIKV